MAGEANSRIGDYVVEKRLAMGGMAEIFLARREGIEDFEKKVVLKRIRPELASEPRFVRMFLDEARLAATLQHHNIAQVYDIGEDDGEYFFAMEYLDGVDARTLLRAGIDESPIPLPIALAIASAVAAGLHHAHEARSPKGKLLGIVHRDISPSNIFITYDGAIKLMDFGIAKAQLVEGRTGSGTLKGKAPYMSPEQIRGDTVDRRSDIFSLGVVLFELATSSRLFRGKTEFQIFRQIVGKPPNIKQLAPDLHPDLAAIITKALARKPEKRFASAQELHRALDSFVADTGLRAGDFEVADYVKRDFSDRDARVRELELPRLDRSTTLRNAIRKTGTWRRPASAIAALAVAATAAIAWFAHDRLSGSSEAQADMPRAETPVTNPIESRPIETVDAAPVAIAEDKATPVAIAEDKATPVAEKKKARRKKPKSKPKPKPKPEKKETKPWDPTSPLPPPKKGKQ